MVTYLESQIGEREQLAQKLEQDKKELERQVEQLKGRVARARVPELKAQAVNGTIAVFGLDSDEIPHLIDPLRESATVVALGTNSGEYTVAVRKDSGKDANALVKQINEATGGKGGGRKDVARGSTKEPAKLREALERLKTA